MSWQTVHYLFCDGPKHHRKRWQCPHQDKPWRTFWQSCVMPMHLLAKQAEADGWDLSDGNAYCPVCTGNRRLYTQMNLPFTLAAALLALLFTSCATPPENAKRGPSGLPMFAIQFESVPVPAHVYHGKAFVGVTPCETEIEGNPDGTFNGGAIPWLYDDFSAIPATNAPGLFRQEIGFRRSGTLIPGEKIPKKVLFDLRRPPGETNAPSRGSGQRAANQNAS